MEENCNSQLQEQSAIQRFAGAHPGGEDVFFLPVQLNAWSFYTAYGFSKRLKYPMIPYENLWNMNHWFCQRKTQHFWIRGHGLKWTVFPSTYSPISGWQLHQWRSGCAAGEEWPHIEATAVTRSDSYYKMTCVTTVTREDRVVLFYLGQFSVWNVCQFVFHVIGKFQKWNGDVRGWVEDRQSISKDAQSKA